MKRHTLIWLVLLLAPVLLGAQPPSAGGLEAAIVGGASASAVLQGWCADHGLPKLTAQRMTGAKKPADATILAALGARPGEKVAYRRVRLGCGAKELSEADNWYLPDRLTPAMNRQLEETDTPFGLAVRPLNFSRRTLAVKHAPDSDHLLEVRAVLLSAAGAPFSYVVEDYRRNLALTPGR
ncbi:MAG TPA: hypothetical protein VGF33_04990 [Caulobacteraceae bacterium]|jgi:hypothetical protein